MAPFCSRERCRVPFAHEKVSQHRMLEIVGGSIRSARGSRASFSERVLAAGKPANRPTFGNQYYLGSEKPADSGGGNTLSFRSPGKSFAMASPRASKCF